MDKITFLKSLDRSAAIMRRVGFHPFTRLGRHLFKRLLKDLSVDFDGLRISGPIELRGPLYQMRDGQMEPLMSSLFKDAVKPGAVVLDLGASLGYYTLLAANHGAKVYAFEPDYATFLYLVANIQRNGFTDRVTAVSKAVSDKTGIASFLLHDSPVLNSLFDASGEVKTTIPVECTTLDEFLDEAVVVDVIKMDIQGAELHALKGMERTLAHASTHLAIFVECWPQGLRLTGGSAGALIRQLRELGLTIMVIDEQNRRLSPVDSDIESVKYVNLYCSRNKESL
jgi:FkbM family methyltransferase